MSDFIILDEEKKEAGSSGIGENVDDGIRTIDTRTMMEKINDFLISFQKIKTPEKVVFYRLLSTMTNAGMSLLKSVQVLEKQEKSPILKKIL
ncbi:MAG: hypothetical protein H6767_06495 [Candidatus Peribacteria bacterium]|nr:MAG: hypothetical protein H6767_06495 [Candidatus Peribacteria bacterium]